jgi:hypothetical protein
MVGAVFALLFVALLVEISLRQLRDLHTPPPPDDLAARIRMARIKAGLPPEPD